jgi:glutamine synthetase type III
VGGSNYINGNIDYLLEIEMPAQEMGNSLQPVVQKFGVSTPTPEKVILGFQALGPFANPVIKPASFRLSGEKTSPITGTSMKDQIQETKQKVQEQIQETKTQLKEQVEEKKEQVQQQLEKQVEQKKEETQQKVQEKKEEVQQQLEEKKKEVEQKVKGFGLPKFP